VSCGGWRDLPEVQEDGLLSSAPASWACLALGLSLADPSGGVLGKDQGNCSVRPKWWFKLTLSRSRVWPGAGLTVEAGRCSSLAVPVRPRNGPTGSGRGQKYVPEPCAQRARLDCKLEEGPALSLNLRWYSSRICGELESVA
jgi:hypothetical protein